MTPSVNQTEKHQAKEKETGEIMKLHCVSKIGVMRVSLIYVGMDFYSF